MLLSPGTTEETAMPVAPLSRHIARTTSAALSAILALALATTAQAKWARPPHAPVKRLLTNTRAYIKDHPKEADAWFVLARINALAYQLEATELFVTNAVPKGQTKKLPELSRLASVFETDGAKVAKKDRDAYLHDGVDAYRKAIALDDRKALYFNGLGSLLVEGVDDLAGPQKKAGAVVPARRKVLEEALDAYRHAFDLDVDAALAAPSNMLSMTEPHPAVEAGEALHDIAKKLGDEAKHKDLLARVDDATRKVKAKPGGPITPIVLRTDGAAESLSALLDPARTVAFDLDGDGAVESRPWVSPGTALLVWDADGDGRIDSGRELIGSVTWWIFWRDGYRVLDALDDDRDGQLTGAELDGLALWTDADGGAVSDPGELATLAAAGIEALSTRAEAVDAGSPWTRRGALVRGRGWVPTWDWTLPGELAAGQRLTGKTINSPTTAGG
jgi:hypothetical protein